MYCLSAITKKGVEWPSMAVRAVETSRFQRKLKRFRKTWRSGNPPLPSCSTSGQPAGTHAFWLCMLSWDIPQKIKQTNSWLLYSPQLVQKCLEFHNWCKSKLLLPSFPYPLPSQPHRTRLRCKANLAIISCCPASTVLQQNLVFPKPVSEKETQGSCSEKSENRAKIVQQTLSHQLLTSYQRMLLPCSTLRSWPSALCSNS